MTLNKNSYAVDDLATTDVDETQMVKVANSNTFKLPETGGICTAVFTLAGSLMMGSAGVMLVSKKRKGD